MLFCTDGFKKKKKPNQLSLDAVRWAGPLVLEAASYVTQLWAGPEESGGGNSMTESITWLYGKQVLSDPLLGLEMYSGWLLGCPCFLKVNRYLGKLHLSGGALICDRDMFY